MPAPNIGWLFYVDYFRAEGSLDPIDFRFIETREEEPEKEAGRALARKCTKISNRVLGNYSTCPLDDVMQFVLETTYPGLLVGGGYQHEVHVEGEFKLGFFFDYTTGLPTIPGSSVKGVLRSAFEHQELITEYFPSGKKEINLEELKIEIFEGVDLLETNKGNPDAYKEKKNWKYLPSPKKDVFHDAIISITDAERGSAFLAADFITPHKNKDGKKELDQFSDPNPLQFMKVLPKVKFLFQFDVKDSHALGIRKEEKVSLFKDIIKTLGVGAKTRTGYGWMEETLSTVQNAQNTH